MGARGSGTPEAAGATGTGPGRPHRDPGGPAAARPPAEALRVFRIPMRTRFRGQTVREGVLLKGPAGWGEFSPFPEYGPAECARWRACAEEAAFAGWPAPLRDRIPVNAI